MENQQAFTLLTPPDNLKEFSDLPPHTASYVGASLYISGMYQTKQHFGIQRVDRPRHMYILGKSGNGKSQLLETLIRQDIEDGYGVAIIDPHGDLAHTILSSIPNDRIEDVVYINPTDPLGIVAFNPFAQVAIENRQLVSRSLVEIFRKQFASTWSPRIEHLFRFATLAMLEYPQGTLYGILQLLTDAQYRQHVLTYVQDDIVKKFFSIEFAGYSQKYDQEAITPLTSRLGHFFSDKLLRDIFTNPENSIDMEHIMNSKKILVVNTAKGLLGEENSALFGSFFLTKIEQAAMARAGIAQHERQPFYLYVDEFQNVATESFTSLFSESRKYAINITIANQYLGQISPNLMNAILGNVGIMITFRLGGSDAQRMALEFQPEVNPHDFLNLGVGQMYIKMSIDGAIARPFSATTSRLKPSRYVDNYPAVVQYSHDAYGPTHNTASLFEPSTAQKPNTDTLLPPL